MRISREGLIACLCDFCGYAPTDFDEMSKEDIEKQYADSIDKMQKVAFI